MGRTGTVAKGAIPGASGGTIFPFFRRRLQPATGPFHVSSPRNSEFHIHLAFLQKAPEAFHAILGRAPKVPVVPVVWNKVDKSINPPDEGPQGFYMGKGIVHVFQEGVFQRYPVSGLSLVPQEGLTKLPQGVNPVHRHKLRPQLIFRRMEGDGQTHSEPRISQGVDAGHHPRSRKGHVPDPQVAHSRGVKDPQGFEHLGGVEQGLSHAHEHHVLDRGP